MLPDQVSNPGPLTYESGAIPIALRGPAIRHLNDVISCLNKILVVLISILIFLFQLLFW